MGKNNYLGLNNGIFRSITGKELDRQLIEFTKTAQIKRYFYISKNYLRESIPDDPTLLHPVYVTPEEREKFNNVKNMIKDAISAEIFKMFEKISNFPIFNAHLTDCKNHSSLVCLYQEIDEYLQEEPDLFHS